VRPRAGSRAATGPRAGSGKRACLRHAAMCGSSRPCPTGRSPDTRRGPGLISVTTQRVAAALRKMAEARACTVRGVVGREMLRGAVRIHGTAIGQGPNADTRTPPTETLAPPPDAGLAFGGVPEPQAPRDR
jgi:hypothetical protein